MEVLNILVDYDNIRIEERRKGILYLTERILNEFRYDEIEELNINFRLYSGWYEEEKLTKSAQDLSSEIKSIFPTTVSLKDSKIKKIVNAEMAYSLIAHSSIHLLNTYRIRGFQYGLKSISQSDLGCDKDNCPVATIYDFIHKGKCSICKTIKPKDIFYKGEQKLVDTMITSDLLYLAINYKRKICLVSTDDDFTPGIMTALALNIKVVHVKTKDLKVGSFNISRISENYILKQIF